MGHSVVTFKRAGITSGADEGQSGKLYKAGLCSSKSLSSPFTNQLTNQSSLFSNTNTAKMLKTYTYKWDKRYDQFCIVM